MLTGIHLVHGSFAIIVMVTLLQCIEGDVILARDDTPVWTAYCSHRVCDHKDNLVTYNQLEKERIKRAFDYWKSDRFTGISFPTRKNIHRALPTTILHDTDVEFENFVAIGSNISQVSVLIVVDYDAREILHDASRDKYINEKIIYVLAYWNSFNMRVSMIDVIKNKLYVFPVGIIISLNRAATPYVKHPLSRLAFLENANSYWRGLSHTNFPCDDYHAVAIMTDILPTERYFWFEISRKINSPAFIVWDNQRFMALHRTTDNYSLKDIIDYLRYRVVQYPKDNNSIINSGNKIDNILAGMLMSPDRQCVERDFERLSRICPEFSKSCRLWCENKPRLGKRGNCVDTGPALEGTPCIDGKILPTTVLKVDN